MELSEIPMTAGGRLASGKHDLCSSTVPFVVKRQGLIPGIV